MPGTTGHPMGAAPERSRPTRGPNPRVRITPNGPFGKTGRQGTQSAAAGPTGHSPGIVTPRWPVAIHRWNSLIFCRRRPPPLASAAWTPGDETRSGMHPGRQLDHGGNPAACRCSGQRRKPDISDLISGHGRPVLAALPTAEPAFVPGESGIWATLMHAPRNSVNVR